MELSPRIDDFLHSLQNILTKITSSFEIVFVSQNADSIHTAGRCPGIKTRVVSQSKAGYGTALKEGFYAARGKYVLTMDEDIFHYPSFIYKMWSFREKADVVVASRYIPGTMTNMPVLRTWLSRFLNSAFRKLLSLPVYDISSGYRLYRMDALKAIDLRSGGFDVLEEILIKLYISGYSIKEVPFIYRPRNNARKNMLSARLSFAFLSTLYKMWKLRNTILACDYDGRAYNSLIFLQRYWQRMRHAIIVKQAYQLDFILDAGCGSSHILNTLPHAVGMDVDFKKLRYMRKYEIPLCCASAFSLPFKDETFDGVICSEVIEHIEKNETLWKEFYRVLKPGGTFLLGTPDYNSKIWVFIEALYKKLSPGGYADEHISHYTKKEIIETAGRHGFTFQNIDTICKSEMIARFTKGDV